MSFLFTPFQLGSNKNFLRYKQDRQCTYNITLTRVRATSVAVAKQKF
jgi:hypothetical protein